MRTGTTSGRRAALVRQVQEELDRLYPDPEPSLAHADPFTLLVATILSAQCTDRMVDRVTGRLFRRARTPAGMARLGEAAVLEIVRPCGLGPTKARAIVGTSRALLRRHGGRVPADLAALEALPGVGRKTASVVLAQGFGVPAAPVDTHVHRLMRRWGLSDGSSVERTEADFKRAFPRERWNRLHLQMIFFGREHCPARGHDRAACPICRHAGRGDARGHGGI